MSKLKPHPKERGFSLIEMAIVLAIIGVFVVVGLNLYQQHEFKDKIEKTETAMSKMSTAIGSFRSAYGRYPCPASLTAAPGDTEYGVENADCKAGTFGANGTCSDGLCFTESDNASSAIIVIGTLPYKTMGLPEDAVLDGKGNRLLYAVTGILTSANTFDITAGGISIVDADDDTLITPEHSAHFLIATHGMNEFGAYNQQGALPLDCTLGSTAEQENCNNDNIFRFTPQSRDFDDTISYYTPVALNYWQKETTTSRDIFLRGTGRKLAIGAEFSDDLSASRKADIREKIVGSGLVNVTGGNALSDYLCEYNPSIVADDCFESSLIGGKIADGEGITCGPTELLVAFEYGGGKCEEEVFLSCPDNAFVSRIDKFGNVYCSTLGTRSCTNNEVEPMCGKYSRNIRASLSSPGATGTTVHGNYYTVLSGKCFDHAPESGRDIEIGNLIKPSMAAATYDLYNYWDWWTALAPRTPADIVAEASRLNDRDRVERWCDSQEVASNPNSALVRETFQCDDAGWLPVTTHERLWYTTPFPVDILDTTQPAVAEIGSPTPTPYSLTYNQPRSLAGAPPGATTDHDCWCREDIRATVTNTTCPSGYTPVGGGVPIERVTVEKWLCPSTAGYWLGIHEITSGCLCDDDAIVYDYPLCSDFYNNRIRDPAEPIATPDQIEGEAIVSFDNVCVAGSPTLGTYLGSDTRGCFCRNKPPRVDTTACPTGSTNSYTVPGEAAPRIGVETVTLTDWICPPGVTPSLPGTNTFPPGGFPLPGYWGSPVALADVPPCVCDNTLTDLVTKPCPSGQAGAGLVYKKEWDCVANDWEPEADWELISTDCRDCIWKSTDTPTLGPRPSFNQINGPCACGDAPTVCFDFGPDSSFWRYTNCQCTVRPL